MTAEQIHEFGKADAARIHKEMSGIMEKVGFKGNLQEFFTFVRTEPNNFYADSDAGCKVFLADARAETAAIFKVGHNFSSVFQKPNWKFVESKSGAKIQPALHFMTFHQWMAAGQVSIMRIWQI